MTYDILQNNSEKSLTLKLPMLICFAMFAFWQMGFIYFVGPALNIDGRTPLPISMDNVTMLIVIAYILSILFLIVLPRMVILTGRLITFVALLSAIGLFFPFSEDILRLFVYVQVFCCCYLIGYESFIIINFFSEKTAIKHLTLAYGVAYAMIALVQNDFLPITFPFFRIVNVVALVMLLVFYMRMPAAKSAYPQYVKKGDTLVRPMKLMIGTFIIIFIASLMGVSGPSISGEITNGVFIAYLSNAPVCILIFILYNSFNIHPFRSISLCIGTGAVGYLMMIAADYLPALSYLACGLIGTGLIACQMVPLFSTVLMRMYPSKYYTPITISLALAAVLVQSSMVELFRAVPFLLYLIYSIIMVILAFIYLKYEPNFIYVLIGNKNDDKEPAEDTTSETVNVSINDNGTQLTSEQVVLLNSLTKREMEVLELLSCGYSNADISQKLVISEHTVNDYTKKIYRKLNVHNRHAAAQFLIKHRSENLY